MPFLYSSFKKNNSAIGWFGSCKHENKFIFLLCFCFVLNLFVAVEK